MKPLWHYTTYNLLLKIVEDGLIRCATEGIGRAELPAVWFTQRQSYEPTAVKVWVNPDGKVRLLTLREMFELEGPVARIQVSPETAPYNWVQHRNMSGVDTETAKRLARVAKREGSDPSLWRVSYEPVSNDKWLAIEVQKTYGARWEPWRPGPVANQNEVAVVQ